MLALSDMRSSQRSLTWPDAAFILQCTYLEKNLQGLLDHNSPQCTALNPVIYQGCSRFV